MDNQALVSQLIETSIHWQQSTHPASAEYLWEHQQQCLEHLNEGRITQEQYEAIIASVGGNAIKTGSIIQALGRM